MVATQNFMRGTIFTPDLQRTDYCAIIVLFLQEYQGSN